MVPAPTKKPPIGVNGRAACWCGKRSLGTPQHQRHRPSIGKALQGRKEVGVPSIGQHDVRVLCPHVVQQALEIIGAVQEHRHAGPEGREIHRIHNANHGTFEVTVKHGATPLPLHPKDTHVRKHLGSFPLHPRIATWSNAPKETEVVLTQPCLHRFDIDRMEHVMPMQATVVDGTREPKAVPWAFQEDFQHRRRNCGLQGGAQVHLAGVEDAMMKANLRLVEPDRQGPKALRGCFHMEDARSTHPMRSRLASNRSDPDDKGSRPVVVYVEKPVVRRHRLPPAVQGLQGEPKPRGAP